MNGLTHGETISNFSRFACTLTYTANTNYDMSMSTTKLALKSVSNGVAYQPYTSAGKLSLCLSALSSSLIISHIVRVRTTAVLAYIKAVKRLTHRHLYTIQYESSQIARPSSFRHNCEISIAK